MQGIAKALVKGVKFGRKAKLTEVQVDTTRSEHESGLKISELMRKYGLGKASVYRYMGISIN